MIQVTRIVSISVAHKAAAKPVSLTSVTAAHLLDSVTVNLFFFFLVSRVFKIEGFAVQTS